jgi:hypothetical protein
VNAQVRLTLGRPTRSLAQVQTPAVIARALDADHTPIPAGGKPVIGSKITKHVLKPQGQEGYLLELPPPLIDGVYQFTIDAIGPACGGTFQRYSSQSRYVGGKVDPKRTTVKVSLGAGRQASVTVIPRGSSGAPIGSVAVSALGASVRGGSVITANDNRDGSFTFRVTWRPRVRNPLFLLSGDGWRIEKELQTTADSD